MSPDDAPPPSLQTELFAAVETPSVGEGAAETSPAFPRRGVRLRQPNRGQMAWGRIDLDALVAPDDPVRAIWEVVGRLSLDSLYADIKSRDEQAGASAIDPRLLVALWVYATSEGVASAREIERLTECHSAYRWLCGGVSVGYRTLSDFRVEQGELFERLVTEVLGLLMQHDLVCLHRVAQDGTRVRASAGASSFRREPTLQSLIEQARAHLQAVLQQAHDGRESAVRAAAKKRGAEQRLARLEAALAQMPEVVETKKRSEVKKPKGAKERAARVSTTDPEARVMKMGDGGFRPAYNIQFATTTDAARVIVGVSVSNRGSDANESTPMIAQIEERTGQKPEQVLVDGGYAQHKAIDEATAQGVTVFAPVPKPRKDDAREEFVARASDSEAVGAWRERMGSEEAKQVYKQRAATAETVNADAKTHRGLDRLLVRGTPKVLGCACLFALTYNILRLLTLQG